MMSSTQLNVRTSETLLDELDTVVKNGMYRNRTEAVNEAIRWLIRRYKVMKIADKIDSIAEKDLGDRSLTEALMEVREEEDQ